MRVVDAPVRVDSGGGDTLAPPRGLSPARHAGQNPFTSVVSVLSCIMATGKVDFFNDTGGYGFIDTEDSDEDVFFHMEDIGGPDLEEGQEVEFEITQSDKGPRAKNLVRQ